MCLLALYSRRIDNLDKAFDKLLEVAGVDGLIFKDLRKYFNHILVNRYGFSNKEATSYIGNSPEVNLRHYDPVDPAVIRSKTEGMSFNEIIGLERVRMMN